jgi:glycerophosphodiester phosphodiesterase
MCVSKLQLPRSGPKSGRPVTQDTREIRRVGSAHIRSLSLTEEYGLGTQEIRDRLKHTVDFKVKGFKPNTRGDFIQAPFATLEDVLTKLPESVGLNVEISKLCLTELFQNQLILVP